MLGSRLATSSLCCCKRQTSEQNKRAGHRGPATHAEIVSLDRTTIFQVKSSCLSRHHCFFFVQLRTVPTNSTVFLPRFMIMQEIRSQLACVAAGYVTKSRYSPSAQRLPKACSDTPRMDTRIFVSISDWLVSYAPYDWSYSCKISKYKYYYSLRRRANARNVSFLNLSRW